MLASPTVTGTESLHGKCHILSDYKISLQTFHPPTPRLTRETGRFEKLSEFLQGLQNTEETKRGVQSVRAPLMNYFVDH